MYGVLDKGVCRLENSTGNVSCLITFTPNPINTEQVGKHFLIQQYNEKGTVL